MKKIVPQEGYQTQFLSSSADIVIGGGAAGAGKTFSLLMEAARNTNNKDFSGIIFRKTSPQITNPGGLWDESSKLYGSLIDAPRSVQGNLTWHFKSGAKIKFSHLQHEKNIYDYQGAQIAFIGWDELTHFSEKEFFYLLSRNRSACGVKPYMRATCNPQTAGWVKELISWWLYPDNYEIESLQGYPIPQRSGVVRYFFKESSGITWGSSKKEVVENAVAFQDREFLLGLKESDMHPYDLIKSITFIAGSISENKKLLSVNPEYLSNLHSLPDDEKDKMLGGCWKARAGADIMFDYAALYDMFSNSHITGVNRYLTADVALEGSDNFILNIWEGWKVVCTSVIEKSDGKEVIDEIQRLKDDWEIRESNICFDADGVGGFIKGFFPNAISFHNGGSPIKIDGDKQDYENLRAQCSYYFAKKVNNREVYMVDTTHKSQTIKECYAVRKIENDGMKIKMSSKAEIKKRLKGKSPDYFDSLMMRSIFDLNPQVEIDYAGFFLSQS